MSSNKQENKVKPRVKLSQNIIYLQFFTFSGKMPSSETQGHSVGARESLNGRENMARRKVKDG